MLLVDGGYLCQVSHVSQVSGCLLGGTEHCITDLLPSRSTRYWAKDLFDNSRQNLKTTPFFVYHIP